MDTTGDLVRLIDRARSEQDPERVRQALVQALLGLGEAELIGLAPLLEGIGGALDGRWPGVPAASATPMRRAS